MAARTPSSSTSGRRRHSTLSDSDSSAESDADVEAHLEIFFHERDPGREWSKRKGVYAARDDGRLLLALHGLEDVPQGSSAILNEWLDPETMVLVPFHDYTWGILKAKRRTRQARLSPGRTSSDYCLVAGLVPDDDMPHESLGAYALSLVLQGHCVWPVNWTVEECDAKQERLIEWLDSWLEGDGSSSRSRSRSRSPSPGQSDVGDRSPSRTRPFSSASGRPSSVESRLALPVQAAASRESLSASTAGSHRGRSSPPRNTTLRPPPSQMFHPPLDRSAQPALPRDVEQATASGSKPTHHVNPLTTGIRASTLPHRERTHVHFNPSLENVSKTGVGSNSRLSRTGSSLHMPPYLTAPSMRPLPPSPRRTSVRGHSVRTPRLDSTSSSESEYNFPRSSNVLSGQHAYVGSRSWRGHTDGTFSPEADGSSDLAPSRTASPLDLSLYRRDLSGRRGRHTRTQLRPESRSSRHAALPPVHASPNRSFPLVHSRKAWLRKESKRSEMLYSLTKGLLGRHRSNTPGYFSPTVHFDKRSGWQKFSSLFTRRSRTSKPMDQVGRFSTAFPSLERRRISWGHGDDSSDTEF